MNWTNVSKAVKLTAGTVCWVRSESGSCTAAILHFEQGRAIWHCHGQEHFRVHGVKAFIVLPTK